ncbi:hypothetical protein CB0940_07381 [Cercospora beticola]|uniref:Uncharacterized protein n=1 Tax=Cercospora beticola TaxID=122368 RepID=A0A2G5HA05_CERBT|nr:hypothetical protein CB0940_07381 [Cercospora beticola]PIA89359.1 hypothetical protein CB0940_07381 [Cercospora beticola]
MSQAQPGLVRRATQAVSQHLGQSSSIPNAPTHWHDAHHRQYLLMVWDKTVELAATSSKYPQSSSSHLHSTYVTLMRRFPDLEQGTVPLTTDWMEYVLGAALRRPFCTAERMGRWEVLASSGGSRGTWGPW